jgi:hypothetical protein
MKLHSRWFPVEVRNDEEARTRYEETIKAGGAIFTQRLYEIIAESVEELMLPEALDDYNEGWQYREADRNGQLRALIKLLDLLEFIDGKRNRPIARRRPEQRTETKRRRIPTQPSHPFR